MAVVSILSTQNLSRTFGGITAVDRVDFSVNDGEIRGIIGPNGAGKTTFVRLLTGRLRCDSGQVVYRETDITNLPSWKRVRLGIAYSSQLASIYPKLTVEQNVAIGAQMRIHQHRKTNSPSADRLDIGEICHSCLHLTGLEASRSKPAAQLAYGYQRMLEIAMCLALEPRLLILDEPTQGLSVGEIEAFVSLLERLRVNRTIILIEHNMPFIMALADRITVMDQGSILADNHPQGIQQDIRVRQAYLGE